MVLVVGLLIAGAALLQPCVAFACSCLPSPSVAASLSESAAVFSGTVTKVEGPQGQNINSADPVTVTFAVQKVWKGAAEAQLIVTTARDSASCGYNFELGQDYLVYANQNDGGGPALSVNLCSRTTILPQAASDLAALGEGQTPTGGQVSNAPTTSTPSAVPSTPTVLPSTGTSRWLSIIVVFSVILIASATIAVRRMRA
jgi:hypothetical protein